MALEKTTVSINLGNGIDQKTDSKVGPDNKFNAMFDWIFDKLGKLFKRPGTVKLPTTVVTSFPNPLTIGTSPISSSTFAHEDQLLIQNKGAIYSYYEDQQDFYFKGHHYPIEIDSEITIASELQYSYPDSQYKNGIRLLIYNALDPVVPGTTYVKYTAIENSTGNVLVDDQTLDSGSIATVLGYGRILVFSNSAFVIWQNASDIKIAPIDLTNGSIGSITVLTNNAKQPSSASGGITANEYPFTFTVTNKAGVGERAMFVYYDTANAIRMVGVLNTGLVDVAMGTFVSTTAVVRAFGIHYNSVADILHVTFQDDVLRNRVYGVTFTSSSITLSWQSNLDAAIAAGLRRRTIAYTLADDPITPTQTYVFYDGYYESAYETSLVIMPSINKAIVNATVVVTQSVAFSYGLQIAGQAYKDDDRQTIYLPAKNITGLQSTLFLYDILKGKTENAPYVQGKWRYGTAYGTITPILPSISVIGTSLYLANSVVTDKIGNPGGAVPAPGFGDGKLVDRLGVLESFIELKPEQAASYSFLSKATHSTGGYMGYYDGEQFCESNYFLQPEFVQYSNIVSAGVRIFLTVTQQGTVSLPEVTTVTCINGPLQLAGPTYYWRFYTPSSPYVIYYIIDGVGSSPAVGGAINIGVQISRADTAQDIVNKTTAAIVDNGVPVTITKPQTNNFVITNNTVGVVTDASAANYTLAVVSGLDAGSYSWLPVWTWFDVNGQVVYSAPGNPIQKTVQANDLVGLVVFAPPLTNRDVASVRVQWYRTKANQTVYFKVSSVNQDFPWNINQPSVGFQDGKSDALITASPELLYTEGGVLPNFQVPSLKNISTFKNRLVASGGDDKTILYYSKSAIEGVPVEFAAEFQLIVDNDNDPITGHIQLDDKLIIFKESKLYYVAGDGPNDTGGNNSLSVPLLIATDVGCISHNSPVICPLGCMFKSAKGIYLLDRSLQVSYIGKEVEDFNPFLICGAILVKDQNQLRFTFADSDFTIVYDYIFNRWSVFSQYGGDATAIWKGIPYRVGNNGSVYLQQLGTWIDAGSAVPSYKPMFETHWMQVKNVQDFQRIYKLGILGDLKSPHNLNYKIYYDYDETNYDSYTFSSSNVGGSRLDDSTYDPQIHLRQQKCDAIKIVIEVEPLGGTEESLQLVDMSFIVGAKRGLMKVSAKKML